MHWLNAGGLGKVYFVVHIYIFYVMNVGAD